MPRRLGHPMAPGHGHSGVPPPLRAARDPQLSLGGCSAAQSHGVGAGTYRSGGRSPSPGSKEPACLAASPTCVLSLQRTQP